MRIHKNKIGLPGKNKIRAFKNVINFITADEPVKINEKSNTGA